ncbi:MAG: 50S ribosomal protein L20 [Deltaproteobacteria bacterium]|nr:50S ribosomal protein L20 [Deltaproteobacteria bacterium]MBI2500219.1 50S ribosomal protein L20 [Deltaproteobacteria bacterium]MBI4196487.1 50S ribosomal protein L20 [Deltaproteobacteria bacterium]
MARAKGGFKTRRRINRILKRAKGFRGAKSRLVRQATEAVKRAGRYAYIHRRMRKRDFRSLWVVRLGAAAKEHGLSYARLIGQLNKAGIAINRKMLSELAIHDPKAFKAVVDASS